MCVCVCVRERERERERGGERERAHWGIALLKIYVLLLFVCMHACVCVCNTGPASCDLNFLKSLLMLLPFSTSGVSAWMRLKDLNFVQHTDLCFYVTGLGFIDTS